MHLIDEQRANEIYDGMGPSIEMSGGSAANTMAGIAALTGRGHYIGKVHDDQLGKVFAHDLRAVGVDYTTPPTSTGAATGCCLILVTPDAQRTMNTYLGASVQLDPSDVDPEIIGSARLLYLEGYLFDPPAAKAAFWRAAADAHERNTVVTLTLSDPFCVDRHRGDFREFVAGAVDVLFANESELCSLYEVNSLDEAISAVRADCALAAITCGVDGSLVVCGDDLVKVGIEAVEAVADTTGAGDLYASGFLFGLARGLSLETCGRLGAICAAEVISHLGARPQADLAELVSPVLGSAPSADPR